MKKSMIAVLMAGSLSLGACTTTQTSPTVRSAATGAGLGAATGAAVGAVVGGLSPIEGAVIGAAVGGIAGAVWHDMNNDGRADGYVREGKYYQGVPAGYVARSCPSIAGRAATGAAVGAAGGAATGALVGGLGTLEGAAIGALVGGVAGAIWADQDRDGCVDGYNREGRYYQGAPQPVYQAPVYQSTVGRAGERG